MSSTSLVNSFVDHMHHSLDSDKNFYCYSVDHTPYPEEVENQDLTEQSGMDAPQGLRPKHGLSRQAEKIIQLAKRLISRFAELWKTFAKKALKFTKIILKSISLHLNEAEVKKIKNALAYLGLASLIELGFNIRGVIKDSKQLDGNIKLKDGEGAIWSSSKVASDLLSIVKTLISCGGALDKLFNIPLLALFSAAVLPLAFILQTFNTIHSIYKLIINSIELSHLPKRIENEKDIENFSLYLDNKLDVTKQERQKIEQAVNEKYGIIQIGSSLKGDFSFVAIKVDRLQADGRLFVDTSDNQEKASSEITERIKVLKAKKFNKMVRRLDKKIVAYMVNAKKALAEASAREKALLGKRREAASPESEARRASGLRLDCEKVRNFSDKKTLAKDAVKDLRKLHTRKLTLNSAKTITCLAGLALEILSIFLSPLASATTALSFSACKAGFSVFKKIYKSKGMHHGLHNPQFFLQKA